MKFSCVTEVMTSIGLYIFLLLDCFGYCKPIKCSDNRLFIVCGSVVDIDNTSESDVQLLPNR